MSVSETSTIQPPNAQADEAEAHGRHRGQFSAQETEAAPNGRHRKPAGQQTDSAA